MRRLCVVDWLCPHCARYTVRTLCPPDKLQNSWLVRCQSRCGSKNQRLRGEGASPNAGPPQWIRLSEYEGPAMAA